MEQWKGKVAFVTGASAGLGYDLSRRLCELGMNVVGCARNIKKIEELSEQISGAGIKGSGRLLAVKCDVSQEEEVKTAFQWAQAQFGGVDVCVNNAAVAYDAPVFSGATSDWKTMLDEEEVKTAFQWAQAQFGGVDVCVNNAAVAYDAPVFSGATSDWKTMLDVNVLGVCICTREFMAQLKERSKNSGHIFLINGMAGHRVINLTDNVYVYGATKYAITGLTEGIRRELREMDSNVKVTAVSPGCVRTEFVGRMRGVDDIDEFKKNAYAPSAVLETEDVTAAIVYALSTPPRVQIHDILMRPIGQLQ